MVAAVHENMFVHVGIIHIALNMWCLWYLGDLAERFMGRKSFTFLYFATGLFASLGSLAWGPIRVSAGASGAIFGAVGGMVSYLFLKKAPIDIRFAKERLKSLAIFIGINLVWGLQSGIDNAAHTGGLISGLVIGAFLPAMILEAPNAQFAASSGSAAMPGAIPPALGAKQHSQSQFIFVAIATAAALAASASAVAHSRIPKMPADASNRSTSLKNGSADLIPILKRESRKIRKIFRDSRCSARSICSPMIPKPPSTRFKRRSR